jgi:hypothetical protein
MKITEKNGKVTIGEEVIEGYLADNACQKCGTKQIYYEKFDTFFCPTCNMWLEKNCPDPKCEFCKNRPDKPLKK